MSVSQVKTYTKSPRIPTSVFHKHRVATGSSMDPPVFIHEYQYKIALPYSCVRTLTIGCWPRWGQQNVSSWVSTLQPVPLIKTFFVVIVVVFCFLSCINWEPRPSLAVKDISREDNSKKKTLSLIQHYDILPTKFSWNWGNELVRFYHTLKIMKLQQLLMLVPPAIAV